MPMATNASVKQNNGQSKCAIVRRSICTTYALHAHLLLIGPLLLYLEVLFIQFLRHRCGRVAAVTTVLDQHRHGDLRILRRRVGDKPGMIATEVGELFTFYVTALHLDDLRRAGLAGDLDHLGTSHAAGAALDDIDERAAHSL